MILSLLKIMSKLLLTNTVCTKRYMSILKPNLCRWLWDLFISLLLRGSRVSLINIHRVSCAECKNNEF